MSFFASLTSLDKIVATTAKTIAPIMAGKAPETSNPGTIREAMYKITAFTTNANKPKVIILSGAVKKDNKGFSSVLIIPRMIAAKTADANPSTLNPGTM